MVNVMRLIDADALKRELTGPDDDWSWGNGLYVKDMIDSMPTIDAIPISLLKQYGNEPIMKQPIQAVLKIWEMHKRGCNND